MSTEVRSLC